MTRKVRISATIDEEALRLCGTLAICKSQILNDGIYREARKKKEYFDLMRGKY